MQELVSLKVQIMVGASLRQHSNPFIMTIQPHIKVHIGSAVFTIQEKADFPINLSKAFPQTFDYLGTTISIDKVEVGQSTKIVMTEELNAHRAYESVDFRFFDKDNQAFSFNSNIDGYYFDKNGTKYEGSEYSIA